MNASVKHDLLLLLPEDMEIDGKNAISEFREKISTINHLQTNKIKGFRDQLCNKIAIDSFSDSERILFVKYNQWVQQTGTKSRLKKIEKYKKIIKSQYNKLHEKFLSESLIIYETLDDTRTFMKDCWSLFDYYQNGDVNDPTSDASSPETLRNDLIDKINGMNERQKHLESSIHVLSGTLSFYNKQRLLWVEFLIGSKEVPEPAWKHV